MNSGKEKEKSSCNFQVEYTSLQEKVLWALAVSKVGLILKDTPSSPTGQNTTQPVAWKI